MQHFLSNAIGRELLSPSGWWGIRMWGCESWNWANLGRSQHQITSFQLLHATSPQLPLAFSAATQQISFIKSIWVEFLVTCTIKGLSLLKLCVIVKTFLWQRETLHGFMRSIKGWLMKVKSEQGLEVEEWISHANMWREHPCQREQPAQRSWGILCLDAWVPKRCQGNLCGFAWFSLQ